MISNRLGHRLDGTLAPIARRIRFSPNSITFAGFIITAAGGIVMAVDLRAGGALVLAGGLMDMLDGAVARTNGKASEFGAFLDSVLDRYSDAAIFLGMAWRFESMGDMAGAALSLGTMLGALLTSYARARAEGVGIECRTGLLERPERIALVVFGAFTGWMVQVLWAMLVLTHLTVLQRVLHVRRAFR